MENSTRITPIHLRGFKTVRACSVSTHRRPDRYSSGDYQRLAIVGTSRAAVLLGATGQLLPDPGEQPRCQRRRIRVSRIL